MKSGEIKRAAIAAMVFGLLAAPWVIRAAIAEDAPPGEAPVSPAPTDTPATADAPVAAETPPVAASAPESPAAPKRSTVDLSSDRDKSAAAMHAEASGMNLNGGGRGTNLDHYMMSKSAQQFTGKPISLHVRDVDAADVFRLISEASGFNIILGDDVKGRVTLSMSEVPWDQALDVVLHTLHLGVERNNNILRIMTLQSLTSEKLEQIRAQKAADASAPKITKLFPISYADLKDLAATLQKFVSSVGGGDSTTAPVVQIDNRTNSLIVRDIPENIERMKKLIELLDTQTPQVLVEARVVEATEGFSKNIGGKLGFGHNVNQNFGATFGGIDPLSALVGTPGVFSDTAAFATADPVSTMAMSFLPGPLRLNAMLSMGESENQVKVVAAPKTVVLNKGKASIIQGTPVLVKGTTTIAGVGTVSADTVQSANLSLDVTPTITNDGGVHMELRVTRDVPQSAEGGGNGIANRSLTTTVLVDSGSTLVIGGIYTMSNDKTSKGFPFLRKIPIIGALFGSEAETSKRSEIFIFITPRILNTREAGLAAT